MKKTILGVVIALSGYAIGCKASYDLGYHRCHKKSVFDYELGWEMAKYVYQEKKPEDKKDETADKEKSE